MKNHKPLDIGIIIALLLFSLSLIYSQRYSRELTSIVDGFVTGWTLFIISIGITSYISIFHYDKSRPLGKLCLVLHGVVSIIFVTVFPYLTGFFMYGRSDTMAQFGWINDILQSGNITSGLIYPVFHILSADITLITGIDPRWAMAFTISATILAAGIALIPILDRICQTPVSPMIVWSFIILILLALPFRTYHLSYYPAGLSTLYLPVAILVTYHLIEGKQRIHAIIIFAFVILTHPFGFFELMTLIGVVFLFGTNNKQLSLNQWTNRHLMIPAFGIVLILGFLWYEHSGLVAQILLNTYESIFVAESTKNVENTAGMLSEVPTVEFILLRYSPHMYLIIFTLAVPVFLYSIRINDLIQFMPLYLWGILTLLFGVVTFFATSLVGPMRFLDGAPAVWVSILALLYFATKINIPSMNRENILTFIFIILVMTLPITLITGFPTPLTYQASPEIAHEDKATVDWYMEYQNEQYTESIGLNRRAFLTSLSFTEEQNYEPSDQMQNFNETVTVGDGDSLSGLEPGQLIIINGWHTAHADNDRFVETRTFAYDEFDQEGVIWLKSHTNKTYSDGENSVLYV